MLTTAQVDHFRTFGFVILRGYLAGRAATLRAEVDAAIRDACAASGTPHAARQPPLRGRQAPPALWRATTRAAVAFG